MVPLALEYRPGVLADEHVSAGTFTRYVRVLAEMADHRTGRGIERTNEQLAERIGCCERTVQRCRRVAEQLGLYVTGLHGRQLTRGERLQAWRAGSQQRGLANSAALVVPCWLLPRLLANRQACQLSTARIPNKATSVGDVAPPWVPDGSQEPNRLKDGSFAYATAGASRRAQTTPADTPRRRHRGSPLAVQVLASWQLGDQPAGMSPWRITPLLAPYAAKGWTARDIWRRAAELRERVGYRIPVRIAHRPWALLAWLLRDVDPVNDHPRLEIEAAQARQAERRAVWAAERAAATPPGRDYRTARERLQYDR